ncbi:MAG: TetR/AcrR family transcriptional regulator [Bacteroidota bacterium]
MNEDSLKERILEGAQEKFMALGISKVSIGEIVEDLGISKKTFYKHFISKEELINQVMNRMVLRVRTGVVRIIDANGGFVEKLHMLFEFLGNTLSKFSRAFQEDLRRTYPEVWQRLEDMRRDTILTNFGKLFSEGARQGMFRNDVNLEVLVLIFLNAVQGVINPRVLTEASFSADQALHMIMNIIHEGVLTDEARKRYRSIRGTR